MMRLWIQHRLQLMGKLNHLHFFHSGGFALEEHPPIQGPIRLRITCSEESITPVISLRIRIPISENEFE